MSGYPWSTLGIAPTGDARAIRSAYAARIKAMDLDADVEGYAELRGARDLALRLAKTIDLPSAEPEPAAAPVPASPAQWPHAPATLAGEWHGDPALSARLGEDCGDRMGRVSPDFSVTGVGTGEAIAPSTVDPFAVPLLQGHGTASVAIRGTPISPFARLAAILDPAGAPGLAPMDEAEEAQALTLLAAVLDVVHASDLARQDEIEDWLASVLADAWPRSAPLLDEVDAAFAWNREWGKVDARPAIEYLGARLRGYRFQRKVREKGHRYHKAWAELSRPGSAGPLRFLRAGGSDVRGLLAGIRKHFPEVEDHLDATRIASWEKGSAWPTGAIVFFGLVLMGILLSLGDPKGFDPAARSQTIAATIAEAFGPGHEINWLKRLQPDLASKLSDAIEFAPDGRIDRQGSIESGVALVRSRTYLDGRQLEGQDFETTMRLRLALLKAAQADGVAACRTMMTLASPPPSTPVPPQVRDAERRFAASLVERGLLEAPDKLDGSSAKVPGELVRKVVEATKLGTDDVAQAMQGRGTDANRCAATVALLQATLEWQGEGRRAILLTL